MNIQAIYPLTWPIGVARTPESRRTSGPNQMPSGRIRSQLIYELDKLGVPAATVSTNVAVRRDGLPYSGQAAPADPGVVLAFSRKGVDIAMACDRWKTVDANLRAIGLTIEAIRGMERWGVNDAIERAFRGYAELPANSIITPPPASRNWWDVLEVQETASVEVIKGAYNRLLHKVHPDKAGGSDIAFMELQAAYKAALEARR
jgi:hypothetical protein